LYKIRKRKGRPRLNTRAVKPNKEEEEEEEEEEAYVSNSRSPAM
jgi:hypothetical protein